MKYWIVIAVVFIVFLVAEILFRGMTKAGVTLVHWLLAPKKPAKTSENERVDDKP